MASTEPMSQDVRFRGLSRWWERRERSVREDPNGLQAGRKRIAEVGREKMPPNNLSLSATMRSTVGLAVVVPVGRLRRIERPTTCRRG